LFTNYFNFCSEKPELVAPVQEEVGETNGEVSGDLQLKPFEDKVSMEDLLHTVRNSLRNEVGLLQKLEGTKISALKSYLGVLTQYFPSDRREVQMFLVKLSDWIRPQREIEVRLTLPNPMLYVIKSLSS